MNLHEMPGVGCMNARIQWRTYIDTTGDHPRAFRILEIFNAQVCLRTRLQRQHTRTEIEPYARLHFSAKIAHDRLHDARPCNRLLRPIVPNLEPNGLLPAAHKIACAISDKTASPAAAISTAAIRSFKRSFFAFLETETQKLGGTEKDGQRHKRQRQRRQDRPAALLMPCRPVHITVLSGRSQNTAMPKQPRRSNRTLFG